MDWRTVMQEQPKYHVKLRNSQIVHVPVSKAHEGLRSSINHPKRELSLKEREFSDVRRSPYRIAPLPYYEDKVIAGRRFNFVRESGQKENKNFRNETPSGEQDSGHWGGEEVLPPVTPSRERERPTVVSSVVVNVEESVGAAMRVVPQRKMDMMLTELRKMDRDRDRSLHPITIDNLIRKYDIPLSDVMPELHRKFADNSIRGQTNYEDMVKYFAAVRSKVEREDQAEQEEERGPEHSQDQSINQKGQQAQEPEQRRRDNLNSSNTSLSSSFSFMDRDDAMIILELERCLSDSPKFSLERFRETLEAKDHYGNGQVSRQQIVQAAATSNLELLNNAARLWFPACDPTGKGIYNIDKLVKYLERSQPHIMERRHTNTSSSTSQSQNDWKNKTW